MSHYRENNIVTSPGKTTDESRGRPRTTKFKIPRTPSFEKFLAANNANEDDDKFFGYMFVALDRDSAPSPAVKVAEESDSNLEEIMFEQ